MEYTFRVDVKPKDLFKIAMIRIYKNFTGIINVVFTVAMVCLAVRFFKTADPFFKGLIFFGIIMFPILQPLAIFSRSVKQLENLPAQMDIHFDDKGMDISCDGKKEHLSWSRVTNAFKQLNMVVIMTDDKHGYMLTDRVLLDKKDEFFEFVCGKIRNKNN